MFRFFHRLSCICAAFLVPLKQWTNSSIYLWENETHEGVGALLSHLAEEGREQLELILIAHLLRHLLQEAVAHLYVWYVCKVRGCGLP